MNEGSKTTVVRTLGFRITCEGYDDLILKDVGDGSATLQSVKPTMGGPPVELPAGAIGPLIEALTEISRLGNGAAPPKREPAATRLGAVERQIIEHVQNGGDAPWNVERLLKVITDRNKSSIAASCRQLVAKGRLVEVEGGYRRVSQ